MPKFQSYILCNTGFETSYCILMDFLGKMRPNAAEICYLCSRICLQVAKQLYY